MAFPPGFLDELRSRIGLADLVGRRVRLTRRGREWGGLCPFHNEKTPSFYVVEDKGFFHCFGCGAHGDAIGYLMRADNLDFIEAVERLAAEAGLAVPTQTPQERERATRQKTLLEALGAAASFYEAQLWSAAGGRARDYLACRGLDEDTIRRFRLGWAPENRQSLRRALAGEFPEALLAEAGLLRVPEDGGTPYDYFRARVMFPIGDRAGRPIAFGGRTIGDEQPKYLNSPDTPLFEKGRVLYGWAQARANVGRAPEGAAQVIVVEGYMDAIALHRAGFGGAVAPLGTAVTETQLAELWRLAPEPILCFDGDAAGQRAALRALHRALPLIQSGRTLRFVELPPGEDPDSLIRGRGRSGFAELLARAWPLADMLWESEVRGRPRKTPEQLAAIQSRLLAHVATIPDKIVRFEYESLFKKRASPWRAAQKGRPVKGSQKPIFPEAPPPLPPLPGRRNREIFLAIVVAHPVLIEEWVEEIAAIEVPEPELDTLRRAILEIAHANPGLDANALRQHLALCGHAETLGTLAGTVAKHAGFAARGGDDPEVIRLGLTETLQLLRAHHASARDSASPALTADASDDDLRRVAALTERKLQDGPVGGFD